MHGGGGRGGGCAFFLAPFYRTELANDVVFRKMKKPVKRRWCLEAAVLRRMCDMLRRKLLFCVFSSCSSVAGILGAPMVHTSTCSDHCGYGRPALSGSSARRFGSGCVPFLDRVFLCSFYVFASVYFL